MSLPVMVAVPIVTMLSSGCALHGAMHGGGRHSAQMGTQLVKQVERDAIVVTLEIPPLTAGREALLGFDVRDAATGDPVADAAVHVAVRQRTPAGDEHLDHSDVRSAEARIVAVQDQGRYLVRHTFPATGDYVLTAAVEMEGRAEPVLLDADLHVHGSAGRHGVVTPLAVVMAMAVMMPLRWIIF